MFNSVAGVLYIPQPMLKSHLIINTPQQNKTTPSSSMLLYKGPDKQKRKWPHRGTLEKNIFSDGSLTFHSLEYKTLQKDFVNLVPLISNGKNLWPHTNVCFYQLEREQYRHSDWNCPLFPALHAFLRGRWSQSAESMGCSCPPIPGVTRAPGAEWRGQSHVIATGDPIVWVVGEEHLVAFGRGTRSCKPAFPRLGWFASGGMAVFPCGSIPPIPQERRWGKVYTWSFFW